jgi:DNA-binding NtrC family response regulator
MTSVGQTQLLAEAHSPGFVFGTSPAIRSLNDAASEIARTDIPVLIVGESGTGKDAYARLIHRLSPRHEGHFSKINCAAFDLGQLSSQLRPAEKRSSPADAPGTIYLDNLQELDMAAQRLLLSFLPEEESADSGDGFPVRLISSAAINLEPEVEAGRFRRELFFRLNGACLRLPSLRDRVQDVPALAGHFLSKYSHALKKNAPPLTDEAIHSLSSLSWPGNIRELENLVRKMVVFGDLQVAMKDFEYSRTINPSFSAPVQVTSLKVAARAASVKAERDLILQALDRTHWNRKRAARELQISYKSLLYKIKQIGVSKDKHES